VEDLRSTALVNGKPAIIVFVFRQPGANIIETVENVRDLMPHLEKALPETVKLTVVSDRTPPIRGSLI
jgi:multidrug efflux pump